MEMGNMKSDKPTRQEQKKEEEEAEEERKESGIERKDKTRQESG